MNFKDLAPFLKKAFNSSNPQLQHYAKSINDQFHPDDPDAETADDDIVDINKPKNNNPTSNIEGNMIDSGFKELEVEEMLAKQDKKDQLDEPKMNSNFDGIFQKQARSTYWDKLVRLHRVRR